MPETFASPKEWAIAKGYSVKPGKGRMPKDVSEAFKKAERSGEVVIVKPQSGTARVRETPRSADSGNKPLPETSKPKPRMTEGGIIEMAPQIWPNETKAYAFIDGKKVSCGMRQTCFNCSVSLYWCGCGAPRALVTNTSGYIPVTLEV